MSGNKNSLIYRLMLAHAQLGIMLECQKCSSTTGRCGKIKKSSELLAERLGWEEMPHSTDIFSDAPVGVTRPLIFTKAGPVIKRIPKGSRLQAAKMVTSLLEEILAKNDLESWERLLSFPSFCLCSSKRGGLRRTTSQATQYNKK